MKKCYLCNRGNLVKKKVDYVLYGEFLGKYDAEVCSTCKEEFYDEKAFDAMTDKAKAKGLWGLHAKSKIGQSGPTLDIRLPKRIIEHLQLKKGREVRIYPEGKHRIVVEV